MHDSIMYSTIQKNQQISFKAVHRAEELLADGREWEARFWADCVVL